MTVTEVAPEPVAAAADHLPPGNPDASPRRSVGRQGLELALLAGLALVAGLAFTRILPADQLVGRVAVAAVAATVVAELCRRLQPRPPDVSGGVSLVVSLGASLVAYVVVIGLVVFRSDTAAGIPTPTSVHAIVDALVNGAARILTSSVPTPPVASAVLIPVTVAWLVAWTGFQVADRMRSPLAPALPAVVGFGFGLLFGGRAPLVGLTTALVVMAASLGVLRARPASRARPSRGVGLGVALVVVMGLVAAAVSAGMGASPDQLDLHHRHPTTETFSPAITPLSQIQGALLARPAVVQFQVTVPPSDAALLPNWRLAVLDQFDGSQWTSPESYEPAGGVLPPPEATVATTTQVAEHVTIEHLGGVWLPVAGQASTTSLDLVDVGTTSGSLALATGLAPHLSYRVQATVAQFPAAALAAAIPGGGSDADTELPDSAPADLAVIRKDATTVTRKAATPAAKLTALQTYLQSDRFTDTPESDAGQSYARMADFLRKHRSGTAEQFATAFALMARTLGYPTRVAVGFRRGVAVGGRFSVTSLDTYAWPEVHFDSLGWVPYDPTPDASGAAAPAAVAAPGTSPGPASGAADQLEPRADGTTPEATPGSTRGADLAHELELGALVVALLAAGLAPLAVIGLKRRRTRRRRRTPSPAGRVLGAWVEAIDQVRAAHVRIAPSLTNSEVVATAGIHLGPEVAEPLGRLRTLTNEARFGPEPTRDQQADAAWLAADEVTTRVRGRYPLGRRLLMAADPRTLRSSWTGASPP